MNNAIKVKATKGFNYGGKIIKAGETLLCSSADAESLKALGCEPIHKKLKQKTIIENKTKNEMELTDG